MKTNKISFFCNNLTQHLSSILRAELLSVFLLYYFISHKTLVANMQNCVATTEDKNCHHVLVFVECFSPPTTPKPVFLLEQWVTQADLDVIASWTFARHSTWPVDQEKQNEVRCCVSRRGRCTFVLWIQGQMNNIFSFPKKRLYVNSTVRSFFKFCYDLYLMFTDYV